MIKQIKPPPKVNPYGAAAKPPVVVPMSYDMPDDYGNDSSHHQSSGHRNDTRDEPKITDYGLDENFDFEAAVQEEMKKLEQEMRTRVSLSEEPKRGQSPEYRHDVFEEPVLALGPGSPIKLSVAHEPSGGMFDTGITAVIDNVGKDISSPGRRKGAAIANLYGEKDNRMNQKAAKAAEYAIFLQKQIDEKNAAKERERQVQRAPPVEYHSRQPPKDKSPRQHLPNHQYDSPPHQRQEQGNRQDSEKRSPLAHQQLQQNYESNARGYEAAIAAPDVIKTYESDFVDESFDRLRRMQLQSQYPPDRYKASGWGQQGAPEKFVNIQMGNIHQHASPTVYPAPAPVNPRQIDFLSVASNRDAYVNYDRLDPQQRGHQHSPFGGDDTGDKLKKRQKQNEYRLLLERQMEEQKKQKENMNSFWKGEDVPPEVSEAIRSQGVKHLAPRTTKPSHDIQPEDRPSYGQQHFQYGHEHDFEPHGRERTNIESEFVDPNMSPKKNSVARNRLIADIFGNADCLKGNYGTPSPDRDNWKPSEKGGVSKRGMAANDYKALLDAQIREQSRLKEEEKLRLEREQKEDHDRMLAGQKQIEEEQEAEKQRRRAIQAEDDAAEQQRLDAKAQELLANKHLNRRQKPSHPDSPPRPNSRDESRRESNHTKFSPEKSHAVDKVDPAAPMDSVSEHFHAPKTPPRFSRVNIGDGVSNKSRQPHANFRKLEETVRIEERGATPGGALACESSLVPIRDSAGGGNNMIRNNGATNISYSAQWKAQARQLQYHQHHPHANFRPDMPKYDPSQDEEDDAIVVAWQDELNRRAKEGNFAVSPRLLEPTQMPDSPDRSRNKLAARASRSSESNRLQYSNGSNDFSPDDPWGPLGLLSALGDRGHGPANIDTRPAKSRISNNAAEQSLASESFLTYIDNRRPMTQATKTTIDSINTDSSNGIRQVSQHQVPGSPLEGMLRKREAAELQRRRSHETKKESYQRAYYEDDDDSTAPSQYDSLNNLLRSSEERVGRGLFQVAAETPQGDRQSKTKSTMSKRNSGYREEYSDGYRYSDDEELLIIN